MKATRQEIKALDKVFSKFIRQRDKSCQRCGSVRALQVSHYYSRIKKSVRFDEGNCMTLCTGCHMYFHHNPHEHTEFMKKRLGDKGFEFLTIRAHTPQKLDIEAIYLYLKPDTAIKT